MKKSNSRYEIRTHFQKWVVPISACILCCCVFRICAWCKTSCKAYFFHYFMNIYYIRKGPIVWSLVFSYLISIFKKLYFCHVVIVLFGNFSKKRPIFQKRGQNLKISDFRSWNKNPYAQLNDAIFRAHTNWNVIQVCAWCRNSGKAYFFKYSWTLFLPRDFGLRG